MPKASLAYWSGNKHIFFLGSSGSLLNSFKPKGISSVLKPSNCGVPSATLTYSILMFCTLIPPGFGKGEGRHDVLYDSTSPQAKWLPGFIGWEWTKSDLTMIYKNKLQKRNFKSPHTAQWSWWLQPILIDSLADKAENAMLRKFLFGRWRRGEKKVQRCVSVASESDLVLLTQ